MSQENGSVLDQLGNSYQRQKKENRKYLSKLITIVKFLAKQGIKFRGHNKQEDSGIIFLRIHSN